MISLTEKKNEFLNLYCFQNKSYSVIAEELKIATKEVAELFMLTENERREINKAKQLFNTRRGRQDFVFETLDQFYKWFKNQPKKCCYCGIEEEKINALFDFKSGILETSRGRGRNLELERINTGKNENIYSEDNCSLACYICNNHKSDLISADDFIEYFAVNIKKYLEDKYQQMQAKNDSGPRN